LQEQTRGRRNHLVMGRKAAPTVAHSLSMGEQRVLNSFLSGRLPAGQVHTELQRARTAPAPSIEPQPAPAIEPQPVVVMA
jgi:hypothetical protein